jgi:hypothetical protein
MRRSILPALLLTSTLLAGCSSSGGMSTASILGNDPAPTPPAAAGAPAAASTPAPRVSDPTARAFFVGSVSARATKCGYNFDDAKLKTSFLSYETSNGLPSDQAPKIAQIFDVARNGVTKAAADDPNYCNDKKTRQIKADLTRVLAGDYEPGQNMLVAQKKDEGGLFSSFFDTDTPEAAGPSFGSDDWWSSQNAKTGN